METKTILAASPLAASGLTYVIAGADVPGKPLTLLGAELNSCRIHQLISRVFAEICALHIGRCSFKNY
jgi:hypothetical protein